jgi:hypothetical protein
MQVGIAFDPPEVALKKKLLAFVDVLVAVDFGQEYSSSGNRETYSYHKSLKLLLDVHGALTKALYGIDVLFISSPPDQGLRFLFLLNNSHSLHQCLRFVQPGWSWLQLYVESLFNAVDGYMQSYLQVSWAPVLSCLFNPTPRFLGETYSPLTRFESEFEKTYITQKQWKVPDPDVRKNLSLSKSFQPTQIT